MKIAYICDKNTFDSKMSRVRFHSMEAISRVSDMRWLGRGWHGWNHNLKVDENIKRINFHPDLIIGYKPLAIKGFFQSRYKKCIRYNEMYDRAWTLKEIKESNADIVVCHHENDYKEYITEPDLVKSLAGVDLINIPHCAEKTIFKDYGLNKEIDLLLTGAIFADSTLGQHYPLRDRMAAKILPIMSKKFNCKIYQHPGYDLGDASTNRYAIDFARAINSSKISITCSGVPRSRFGKYIEIPMCNTAIAADMPDEMHDFFSEFLINIDMKDSDDEIISKLEHYIKNPEDLSSKTKKGYELSSKFNQEHYAEVFIEKVSKLI
jgi:hypothetical protein